MARSTKQRQARLGEPAAHPGAGQEQQLTVFAEYTDGRKRDVTWLARFDSNDAGVAAVDALGRVTVQAPRRNRHPRQLSGAGRRRHRHRPVHADGRPGRLAAAQQLHRRARLRQARRAAHRAVRPVRRRRVLPPRLPRHHRRAADARRSARRSSPTQRADKRAKLIDALLERPEFVDYWALFLGDLLQNRKERDHDVRGTKGVRSFHDWLRKQVAANRPWDELARDVLTATGKSDENPAVGYYVVTVGEQREAERSEVVASVAQAFLGTRIGCAQCHNHPLEKYTQDDYYHFAAFFSRIKLDRKDPKQGPTDLRRRHARRQPNKQPGRRVAAAHRPVPEAAAARPLRRWTSSRATTRASRWRPG